MIAQTRCKPALNPTIAADAAARFAASVTFGRRNRPVQTAQTRESNYVVWQKQSGSGSTTQTFALPSFVGGVTFQAPGGLSVQVPAGSNLNTQIQTLARQPGMSYLSSLAARSDVNWQPVKLAFDQWSYSQQGLTPAGAALVAVAVAWATSGTGAQLFGTTGTTTSLMANAAFTSLASQAAITLINNQGNIGKTLSDLASSNTAKAALAAVLTAGAMVQIGAMPGMQTLSQGTAFSDKLTFNLINATGRALTSAAIYGGSLESALQTALVSGLIDTAQGAAASKIKLLENDYVIHKLAHALAGCVAGAAAGGACQDGAIGAAVGEMVGQLMPPANKMFYTDAEKTNILALSKLAAGAVSAYAGGNAQTAITTSEVAVNNNLFFVPPLIYLLAAAAAGYTTGVGEGNQVEGLKSIGQGKDPLSQAMTSGTQAVVTLSMSQFPKETTATLNLLAAAGQAVDATLTYVDANTGKVVSTQWNSLSPDTRAMLIGAGKVTGVVLSPIGVGQVKNLITNVPKVSIEQARTLALQGMIREAGQIDPLTGKPLLDLNALAKQPRGLTSLKEATGDMFGSATMKTLFADAQYLGGTAGSGMKGLDAVYKVNSKDVDYLFVEYKYNTSTQGMTANGLQGSMSWVTGSKRIDNAVGSGLAPSVYQAARTGRTETLLIQTLTDGRTNVKLLDANGKSIPITQSRLELVQRITNNLNKGIAP